MFSTMDIMSPVILFQENVYDYLTDFHNSLYIIGAGVVLW